MMEIRAFGDGNSAANWILGIVETILNFNESFDVNDSLRINIQHVQMPRAAGKTPRAKVGFEVLN